MNVTYTAPTRAHHYPLAAGLNRLGCLSAFISGFSRLSPRSPIPALAGRLKRVDFVQTLFVLSMRYNCPTKLSSFLSRAATRQMDRASYSSAKNSDVFIYYRTTGATTCRRLKGEKRRPICIMEEVNSHVVQYDNILRGEYEAIYRRPYISEVPDRAARLRAYNDADYILCPSQFVLRSFRAEGFAEERLLKNPYGCDPLTSPLEVTPRPTDIFRVLYVGQLHYRKGLRYLLEGFRLLRHPRKELIIVGPKTNYTGLDGIIIPPGVRFTGALKDQALDAEYDGATVFVLPSIEEGLSLVQGEALARGLPIISTTNCGAEDLFSDGVQGFIVPPFDAPAIANRLQLFADDPGLRARMSAAALELTHQRATWDRSVSALVATLSSLPVPAHDTTPPKARPQSSVYKPVTPQGGA